MRGAPRANALAKSSKWVAERAPLEALMREDMNELLLATEAGELLEGSQTNFYAICHGAVHTAGEGVLEGTVRRLLLEVCDREGIPVVLAPPRLPDAAVWDGALISSTSRLLLPIDRLYVPTEGQRSDEADLVRAYHEALVQCGVDAAAYPYERCWHDYKWNLWRALLSLCASASAFSLLANPRTSVTKMIADDGCELVCFVSFSTAIFKGFLCCFQ